MLYLFPTITKQTNLLIGHYPAAVRKWKHTDTALCGCKQAAVAMQQCFYKSWISSSHFVYYQNSTQLKRRGVALCKYSIFTNDPESKPELFIKTKNIQDFPVLSSDLYLINISVLAQKTATLWKAGRFLSTDCPGQMTYKQKTLTSLQWVDLLLSLAAVLLDTQCSGVIRSKMHKEKNYLTSCTYAARKHESAVLVFTLLGCCGMAISWSFVTFYLI